MKVNRVDEKYVQNIYEIFQFQGIYTLISLVPSSAVHTHISHFLYQISFYFYFFCHKTFFHCKCHILQLFMSWSRMIWVKEKYNKIFSFLGDKFNLMMFEDPLMCKMFMKENFTRYIILKGTDIKTLYTQLFVYSFKRCFVFCRKWYIVLRLYAT